MTPEQERQAKQLVADVLAQSVPDLDPSSWSLYGPRIRLPDGSIVQGDRDQAVDSLMDYALDVWRRTEVWRLAEERGHPRAVVDLAWELLPYESTPMRYGWDFIRWLDDRRERAEALITDELARANYA